MSDLFKIYKERAFKRYGPENYSSTQVDESPVTLLHNYFARYFGKGTWEIGSEEKGINYRGYVTWNDKIIGESFSRNKRKAKREAVLMAFEFLKTTPAEIKEKLKVSKK